MWKRIYKNTEIFRNKNISVCFFSLVSMSGNWLNIHLMLWNLCCLGSLMHFDGFRVPFIQNHTTHKWFDQFAVFCNSVSESSSLVNIWQLLKVKASPKKNTSSFGHMGPAPQHISFYFFLWKSWKRFRLGLNLRERVDKKETSRKFCYKLVMRYTELRLTFDSSFNLLVQCSFIPVIEMTS